MSNRDQLIDSLFRDLETPSLPSELRNRTLEPALEALRQDQVTDIWSRIWSSRPIRLAWTASLSALVLGHLGLSLVRPTPHRWSEPATFTAGAADLEGELVELLTFPRLRTDVQPLSGLLAVAANQGVNDVENQDEHDNMAANSEENSI